MAGPSISGSLERRIAYTMSKAIHAVTITSVSTAGAFFVNGFSIVPPIRYILFLNVIFESYIFEISDEILILYCM